jgi:hypothetical protein
MPLEQGSAGTLPTITQHNNGLGFGFAIQPGIMFSVCSLELQRLNGPHLADFM